MPSVLPCFTIAVLPASVLRRLLVLCRGRYGRYTQVCFPYPKSVSQKRKVLSGGALPGEWRPHCGTSAAFLRVLFTSVIPLVSNYNHQTETDGAGMWCIPLCTPLAGVTNYSRRRRCHEVFEPLLIFFSFLASRMMHGQWMSW